MKKIHLLLLTAVMALGPLRSLAQTLRGTYAIVNKQTGIYLRIRDAHTENGTPIVAYSPVNWKCVTWDFNNTDGNSYRLTNLFSGKTLQPEKGPAAGVALEEQPLATGAALQQYEFIPVEKGTYLIRLKGTEWYVTPSDDKGTVNAPIVLVAKNNTTLQQWTLHEQHPEI